MHEDILNSLNDNQRQAVIQTDGPQVILAGAGSGKTRVLISKVLYLIHEKKIPAESILMITFTNKAAKEMKERVQEKLGFVGTFHSFCALLLRRYGPEIGIDRDFVIYDEDDKTSLLKSIIKNLSTYKKLTPSTVAHRISSAKDNLIGWEEFRNFCSSEYDDTIATAYEKYQKKLAANHALDFDDLLFSAVQLLRKSPETKRKLQDQYRYILVDEFQDTNFVQYLLTKNLGEKYRNITIVGDFSQSIYSWRGADIKNLEKFQRDFPTSAVFHLERNYRSTQAILDYALTVISENNTHPILKLYTENNQGEDVVVKEMYNEEEEALFVAKECESLTDDYSTTKIAVLYRTNAQSRILEETFLHYTIPYVLVGGTRFYERKEIKDLLSYMRLIVNQSDSLSRERILKLGKKKFALHEELLKSLATQKDELSTEQILERVLDGTGYLDLYDETQPEEYARIENIKELKSVAVHFPVLHDFLQQVALVESEYSQNEKAQKTRQGVHLMTLHQAKGLEFDYVFIVGLEEGTLPHSRALLDVHELEEERRLFYVGVTRAKKKLYITHAQKRFIYGRSTYAQPSRFVTGKDPNEHYEQTF